MTDTPDTPPLKLPKDKKVLVIGAGVAIIGVYWWWNRAPAVPTDTPITPDTSRVPIGSATGNTSDGDSPAPPDPAPIDDTAWAQKVITSMTALGYEPSRVSQVTSKWLDGRTIDSVQEAALVALILARVGLPPSGLHPVLGTVVPAPGAPPPTPKPSDWHGPLVRKERGGPVLVVHVQTASAWLYWVKHEYTNLPPDQKRLDQAAAALRAFNITTRGKAYRRDILTPKDTPNISIPVALPIY